MVKGISNLITTQCKTRLSPRQEVLERVELFIRRWYILHTHRHLVFDVIGIARVVCISV